MKKFTFSKQERLKSRKLTEHLFGKGKSFLVFPVKVVYEFVELNNDQTLRAGVAVSSRNFKKAVDRNRVKRIMREAYRLQKLPLEETLSGNNKQLAVFFLYVGKELPVFEDVNKKMETIIKRLSGIVQPTHP